MKSTKSRKASAAAPKSNIAIILNKLEPTIHAQLFGSPSHNDPIVLPRRAALVANGEEALRILKIKCAMLMPKKDTPMVRAALIIDYLSRNSPTTNNINASSSNKSYVRTTIPVAMLAKAVGFNKKADMKKFEIMQTIMASYLDRTNIGKQKNGKNNNGQSNARNNRKRDASSMIRPDPSTSTSSMASSKPMLTPTDLIRDLCIQLGPMIPDAEFATSYATSLFDFLASVDGILEKNKQLSQQSKNNASKRRRFSKYELRRDMERHQEYYEAACFYLAVKKSEGGSSHLVKLSKKNAATAAAKKKDAKKSALAKEEGGDGDDVVDIDDDDDDDGDEDRPLQEMDVIRMANLLEVTFKTILQYVRDWTEGVSISLTAASGGRSSEEANAKVFFEVVADVKDESDTGSTIIPIGSPFENWKSQVLRETKEWVMKNGKEGDSSKDWLTVAADEVLRKAGL